MGRSKKKRTREEIEQAMRDNERVNATPAALEEPAAKKRRQARRRNKRYNLNKEFQAFALDATEGTTAAASRPPVTTAVQEPVPGTGVPLAPVHTPILAPTVNLRSKSAFAHGTESVPEPGGRIVHSPNRSATAVETPNGSEPEELYLPSRNANKDATKRLSEGQSNRQTYSGSCRRLTGFDMPRDAKKRTPAEREERQRLDRIRQEERRANLEQEQGQAEQASRREYQAMQRDARDDEENEDARQNERTRRGTIRRCHALANHEDFRVSMLRGPNVVDGRHKLPPPTVCPHCNAWKWPTESKKACCLEGAVQLPPHAPAPQRLFQLYGDVQFRRLIRAYNQVFAFTSIGASCSNRSFNEVNQDEGVAGQHGVYTYRIQGTMGHYLGSLLPRVDPLTNQPKPAKFAQIYIVDPDMQQRAERRRGIFADLDPGTLLDIEQMMTEVNPFAQQFLNFAERLRQDQTEGKDVVDMVYRLHEKRSTPRTYNLPTVSEVGATLIEDGNLECPRDILLWAKDHNLLRLFESNPMYDPLQYPLLLPHGELGWTYTDTYANNIERRNKREMSLREHVAYRLYQKVDDQSVLHKGGRLFQQYCVDQRAKCEQEQLRWIATHQAELRADQYCGFQDALLSETTVELGEGEALLSEYNRETGTLQQPEQPRRRAGHFLNLDQIGKRVVLPSTHPGGPRHMFKSYQDAMAVVREFGKPDVFVTMTCSPTWDEIQEKIPDENQSAQDRPDVVARVYQMKLAALLKDLDEGVLGRVQARIYVVEFQKRGLPHAHILAILAEEDKPRTREIIDKLVSAELPDPETNPQLYETILTCMMHGPCGAANPSCAFLTHGRHTMLTRFFELCASEAPENQIAKTIVYQDIPKEFRWDAKTKRWVRRKQFQAALGRMVHVSPRDMERFYLRVLLCHRKGPQSFEHLRTVNGVTYETYRQAALRLGFREDDAEWISCMREADEFRMPYQLRQLFTTILVYSQVAEVRQLWERFYDELSQDFAHRYRALLGQEKDDMIKFKTLKSLYDLLQISGYAVADFDLPQLHNFPALVLDLLMRNNLIWRELEGYDQNTLQEIVDQEDQLNEGQRAILTKSFRRLMIRTKATNYSSLMAQGELGSRTAHSTFKIPLKLTNKSTCAIYKQSHLKRLIQRARLVIWDEAPMTHRHAFEAVDRTLRDIMDNDQEPFGGKVFVLSGDFRQILPVVVRGTPAETIDACLKSSTLWEHFKQLPLTENMRVRSAGNNSTAAELAAFSEFLLQVGEGRHEVNRSIGRDLVKIPQDMLIYNNDDDREESEDEEIRPGAVPRGLKKIIDVMYADINDPDIATDDYFANRTILTTTNTVVHRSRLQTPFGGLPRVSIDR
ncbi:unnamed protein product [Phytophthora fragariaefolia]|uniref:ATP-dependent DNA helicase n=1 Tax=Phytophthora fragariaefolia TaxID=1490495 RepID=A0A9W6XYI7_9STRA|nr:unnamed protein product [Phytophthora fragariaefolia]